jgi:hypothetical protein
MIRQFDFALTAITNTRTYTVWAERRKKLGQSFGCETWWWRTLSLAAGKRHVTETGLREIAWLEVTKWNRICNVGFLQQQVNKALAKWLRSKVSIWLTIQLNITLIRRFVC